MTPARSLPAAPLPPISRRRYLLAALALLVSAGMLFVRLGHYSLWDDEADTALFGESILKTGDTLAVMGHNIAAYDGGWPLSNLHERYIPPVQYYVAAASLGVFGKSAWAARFPFAICGLASVALLLFWLLHERADRWTCVMTMLAFLSSVTYFLYCRQARYYAVVLLLTMVIGYLYTHWTRGWKRGAWIVACCSLMMATNYIGFGAAVACMGVDWLIWGRRRLEVSGRTIALLIAAQAVFAVALLCVYNPFHSSPYPVQDDWATRLLRVWWDLRDLSVNDFWIIPVLLAIPFVYGPCGQDRWLIRGGVAVLVYFLSVCAVEPHFNVTFSQVRYWVGIVPLALAVEARVFRALATRIGWGAVALAIPIFCTNVFSGSYWADTIASPVYLQVLPVSFLQELINPPPDPYTITSAWLQKNLPADTTIVAFPRYTMYPLLFNVPKLIYGWQLDLPPEPQFRSLPAINFIGELWPQYIVLFGNLGIRAASQDLKLSDGSQVPYELVKTLPVYGQDLYRPELFLRIFRDPPTDLNGRSVYILRRK